MAQETGAEWAKRTAREQGLPEYVEDPATLARLAAIIAPLIERKRP